MPRTIAKRKHREKTPPSGTFRAPRWQVPPDRVIQLKSSAPEHFAIITKLQRIVDSLTLAAAADVLGVDRSQLDRCRKGKEAISAEVNRRITDVEYILDRALHVMHADEVGPWLTEPEPLLGGSIPLNVLTLKGTGPVVTALDGVAAGSFA
jgi:uncharacterized protein (DUF2384 family)